MSSAPLRVELPAYSHSFQVQVQPASTIRDVKREIASVCPGAPTPDGQRLIFKGRLLNDDEKVEDVWKSPDDSRIVHLAVHPSAWTSSPPAPPSAPQEGSPVPEVTPVSRSMPTTQPHLFSHVQQPVQPRSQSEYSLPSVAYVQYLHNVALCTLSAGAVAMPSQPPISELGTWRTAVMDIYRNRGWGWPAVFDQPFPSGSTEEGAVYEPVTLEGLPYLSLTTPNATPNASQLHALKVLSYTFPILSMANDPLLYAPSTPFPVYPNTPTANLNQRLQELGFPPLRLVPGQNIPRNGNDANNANPLAPAGAEIRAIPVRALLVPLLMLAFRTLLLLYFFSPSKRPLFGILLSVWIIYEAWNAMRLVLNDGHERVADPAVNPGAPNAAPNAPPRQAAAQPAQAGLVPTRPNRGANRSSAMAILDRLAMINIPAEDILLETDTNAPPPSIVQRTKMFVTLFFLTLYPAAWDRRRAALRRREGRIRTEANARETALTERAERESVGAEAPARTNEAEARARAREQVVIRHERRPAWLKEYVQRVQYSEWVDDP
ncbi:hypothetical protein C8Q79DRAFT_901124 [Trametes meyenii]|nr:hypothetical protein C8Q79DRAFT_901124 [Trametes meyenii]